MSPGRCPCSSWAGEAEKAQQQLVKLKQLPEFPPDVLLAMEREMTGVYISGHPLDGVRDLLEQLPANTLMIAQAAEEEVSGGCATVTRSSWAV